MSVLAKKWNKPSNFYSEVFRPDKLKSTEQLPQKLMYTSRLIITPTRKYFMCLPQALKSENQTQHLKAIFFDPGMKAFLTGYDSESKVINIGRNDIAKIGRLLHHKNKLRSRMTKATSRTKRRNMRLALYRMYERIDNLVQDFHRKTAKWLCENYNYVFLPKLNFHKMNNLNKKSKEKLACLSHCALFKRIHEKMREYPNRMILDVNEAYTTQTCCKCGTLNRGIGNKNIYTCRNNNCRIVIGRDSNAAVNVLLRYFTKRASVLAPSFVA